MNDPIAILLMIGGVGIIGFGGYVLGYIHAGVTLLNPKTRRRDQ